MSIIAVQNRTDTVDPVVASAPTQRKATAELQKYDSSLTNLVRWNESVSARPSAAA